jgi:hypothetical protein
MPRLYVEVVPHLAICTASHKQKAEVTRGEQQAVQRLRKYAYYYTNQTEYKYNNLKRYNQALHYG